MDRGNEFRAEVEDMLKNEYGFTHKTHHVTRNPPSKRYGGTRTPNGAHLCSAQ